jgi:hypothetical protein
MTLHLKTAGQCSHATELDVSLNSYGVGRGRHNNWCDLPRLRLAADARGRNRSREWASEEALMSTMSPRIINIPLSDGDRKAQANGIRHAHGLHNSQFHESVLVRSAAEATIREADRLE